MPKIIGHPRFRWRAALLAGVIAGLAFLLLETALAYLTIWRGPWGPARMLAAVLLGREALPAPPTPDAAILALSTLLHLASSLLFTLLLAWIIHPLRRNQALLAGAGFGIALYLINFYLLSSVFLWFVTARNWISFLVHIAFGLTGAAAYVRLRTRRSGGERIRKRGM